MGSLIEVVCESAATLTGTEGTLVFGGDTNNTNKVEQSMDMYATSQELSIVACRITHSNESLA